MALSAIANADDLTKTLLTDYRHLHQNPELSFAESETMTYMADRIEGLGYEVTREFGGYGLVAVFENGDGPVVMIRADLDALPITEETGLPYASTVQAKRADGSTTGVMHACGHDIHMTVLLGTATRMIEEKSDWSGTLILIGQPAEERSGGAKAMLAEGLFTRFPRPDYNLALHVSADLPVGSVAAVPGYAMANVDSVDILVKGVGGHGAYPHRNTDPVVLAAQIINTLQTIVSREISPLDAAVVTVGSIHGGTQHNITPNEVKLELTVRSYTPEVRQKTLASIRRISRNLAAAAGVSEDDYPVVTILDESTPAAYNNPELTARMTDVFKSVLGEANIVEILPEMVGEDFGRYGAVEPKIPSLLFRLGTVSESNYQEFKAGRLRLPTLHSASYAPEASESIETGVAVMTAAALSLFDDQ